MILVGIDCTEQYEAMKRGEWPEPHPEVVAAHRALEVRVEQIATEDDRQSQEDSDDG